MVNKVILLGNLGADPELKHTQAGQAVCSLRIATSETYKDRDGNKQERTEWHKVIVWGPQGENVAKFCKKGKQIYLEGRLQTRKWQDKDGKDQYTTEVVADNVKFLGGAGGASNEEGGGNSNRGGYGGRGGGSNDRGGSGGGSSGGGGYGRQSAPSRPAPVEDTGFAGSSVDDDIPF